ncbi:hypothetical protein MT414_13925 [Mammaliicoccus sciuri]|uniref:hypothetical protein n=1 Tax=Mammaliicoccus sciuri TaxID=1296 RepID=UPI001FB32038|nr:hypothetical protein [Mammaliicoccus sciuri]MCJ1763112.1 hypothetical protein [Mammaliicoccus sciuri]
MGKYKNLYKSIKNIKAAEQDEKELTRKLFIAFSKELKEMVEDLSSEDIDVGCVTYDGKDGHIELIYNNKPILTYYSNYEHHSVSVIYGDKKSLNRESYSINQFTKRVVNGEVVDFYVEKESKEHFAKIIEKINTH